MGWRHEARSDAVMGCDVDRDVGRLLPLKGLTTFKEESGFRNRPRTMAAQVA
jgi:hypothetical protein